jgi:hypothetical protein
MWTVWIRIHPWPHLRSLFEFSKLRKMFLGWPYVTTAYVRPHGTACGPEQYAEIFNCVLGTGYLRWVRFYIRSTCCGYVIHAVGTDTCGGGYGYMRWIRLYFHILTLRTAVISDFDYHCTQFDLDPDHSIIASRSLHIIWLNYFHQMFMY